MANQSRSCICQTAVDRENYTLDVFMFSISHKPFIISGVFMLWLCKERKKFYQTLSLITYVRVVLLSPDIAVLGAGQILRERDPPFFFKARQGGISSLPGDLGSQSSYHVVSFLSKKNLVTVINPFMAIITENKCEEDPRRSLNWFVIYPGKMKMKL